MNAVIEPDRHPRPPRPSAATHDLRLVGSWCNDSTADIGLWCEDCHAYVATWRHEARIEDVNREAVAHTGGGPSDPAATGVDGAADSGP